MRTRVINLFKKIVLGVSSPAMIVMLVASFVMWYISNLSNTYTIELPVAVNVEGQSYEINFVVEGTGHSLFARKYYKKKVLQLSAEDVIPASKQLENGKYAIDPQYLQDAASLLYSDIRVKSVGDIPEVDVKL